MLKISCNARKVSILTMSLMASTLAYAHEEPIGELCGHHLAIQSAIATGGNFGIGLVDFTETTEIGVTVSGSINHGYFETKRVTPVIFAGLRNSLCENTYFAWGLDAAKTFAKVDDGHLSNIDLGFYISLEQMLTNHVMLVGWIHPYQYSYQKVNNVNVSRNEIFSTGGLGINYVF